jgi:hypothetical protein
MDAITSYLHTGFWVLAAAISIIILLVFFGYYIYQRNRMSALIDGVRNEAELAAQLDLLEARKKVLIQWMQEQQSELERLSAERQEQEIIRAELQRIEQECAAKDQENQALRNEVGELENQRHMVTQTLEKLESEITKHQDEIKKIEAQKNEIERLKSDAEAQRQIVTEQEKTIREQKSELGDIAYKLNILLKKAEELQEKGQQYNLIKSKLPELKQKLDETREELAIQQRLEDETALKVHQLNGELDELEKKRVNIESKTEEHEEIEEKLKKAKDQFADLKQELDDTKNEILIQQRFEDEVARKVQEHNKLLDELKSEKTALKASIESLKIIAKQYKKQLDAEDGAEGAAESKYRDLWQPVTFSALEPVEGDVDERALLTSTAEYIKGQKLKFPERVLNAFHTALKISDISPLVVLAGISGTGKSELPRRYAEGMGIHPVILAVQPRWDSPQDLFGFYNYLESRYKATELARAMVQFELYNWPSWPLPDDWDYRRSDRMLLVLLDEMNLARVEYYFSEFLSRLETRRGINLDNNEERAKAEIALEMGSLHKGEKSIRLFPGYNVLFSGTMNEDETTQALSDKVLDRACVMRFGRPKQLAEQDDSPRTTIPNNNGLTFNQWKSFLKSTLSATERDRVNSWINRLNDAMEQINRPFGHRAAQAIHAYVANYPDWVQNRIHIAMADQIEQRIMPKLRGIEITDADTPLRQIQAVIEECDDPLLLNAFKDGTDSQRQIFNWRGLDRAEE